jgi:hypothetical protein
MAEESKQKLYYGEPNGPVESVLLEYHSGLTPKYVDITVWYRGGYKSFVAGLPAQMGDEIAKRLTTSSRERA